MKAARDKRTAAACYGGPSPASDANDFYFIQISNTSSAKWPRSAATGAPPFCIGRHSALTSRGPRSRPMPRLCQSNSDRGTAHAASTLYRGAGDGERRQGANAGRVAARHARQRNRRCRTERRPRRSGWRIRKFLSGKGRGAEVRDPALVRFRRRRRLRHRQDSRGACRRGIRRAADLLFRLSGAAAETSQRAAGNILARSGVAAPAADGG